MLMFFIIIDGLFSDSDCLGVPISLVGEILHLPGLAPRRSPPCSVKRAMAERRGSWSKPWPRGSLGAIEKASGEREGVSFCQPHGIPTATLILGPQFSFPFLGDFRRLVELLIQQVLIGAIGQILGADHLGFGKLLGKTQLLQEIARGLE